MSEHTIKLAHMNTELPKPIAVKYLGEQCYTESTLLEYGVQVAKEAQEMCAAKAWAHFMDTCAKRRLAPAFMDSFCAAGAIRRMELRSK